MTNRRLFFALLARALFGYYPGPALASVLTGGLDALVFVAALAAGMWAAVRFSS